MYDLQLVDGSYATVDRTTVDFGGLHVEVTKHHVDGYGPLLEIAPLDRNKLCARIHESEVYETAKHLSAMIDEELDWKIHLDEPGLYIKNGIGVKFADLKEGRDFIWLDENKSYRTEAASLFTALSRLYSADNEDTVEAHAQAYRVLSEVSDAFRNEFVCHKWPEFGDLSVDGTDEAEWPYQLTLLQIDPSTNETKTWEAGIEDLVEQGLRQYEEVNTEWKESQKQFATVHILTQRPYSKIMKTLTDFLNNQPGNPYKYAWMDGRIY